VQLHASSPRRSRSWINFSQASPTTSEEGDGGGEGPKHRQGDRSGSSHLVNEEGEPRSSRSCTRLAGVEDLGMFRSMDGSPTFKIAPDRRAVRPVRRSTSRDVGRRGPRRRSSGQAVTQVVTRAENRSSTPPPHGGAMGGAVPQGPGAIFPARSWSPRRMERRSRPRAAGAPSPRQRVFGTLGFFGRR